MGNRRYLYHARINSRLTLEQIGLRTAISPTALRHIDEGRFELLPSGLYARSYVRAFASVVGVNPDEALAEVQQYLPGAPDAIAALHEARAVTPVERLRRALTSLGQRMETRLEASRAWVGPPQLPLWMTLRKKQDLTPWGAAAIDAGLLVAVDAFLVMLISWSSGIAVDVLLRDSGLALAAFCTIPILLYFLLFGGIAGSTLGQYACHLIDRRSHQPLTLPDILRRTFGH